MNDELETTMTRALTESEVHSLMLANQAFERGDIEQEEIVPGSGVWILKKGETK